MKSKYRIHIRGPLFSVVFIMIATGLSSCRKLVDVPPPINAITGENVYSSDQTSIAVLTGIYANIMASGFSSGGVSSLSFFPALSADELSLFNNSNSTYTAYFTNELTNSNAGTSDFWINIYPYIYVVNSVLQNLEADANLTPGVKEQLIGEASFLRAFFYFYLVNLYGDVPLVTGTNYVVNSQLPRTPKDQVWQQIISDLKLAQSQLSPNYMDATLLTTSPARVRPTTWAATALLARAYLYQGYWDSAQVQATAVINNTNLYNLDTLNGVFFANSSEAIWQLQPVNNDQNTQEAALFILPASGPDGFSYPVYLNPSLLNAFELGDQRRIDWIDSVVVGPTTYYYPYKYKTAPGTASVNEYEMVLRLGEQYLIRAEAEAQLNELASAATDLNTIRNRAGLADISNAIANSQMSLLAAIYHERQVELFTEWGHRWLDLKRTGTIDTVMGPPENTYAAKVPNATWNSNWQWYPISLYELQHDQNLVQNTGY